MNKSSCRYAINRAIRDGIHINIDQYFDNFYELNRSFRVQKNISPFNVEPEFIKRYGVLFTAEIDGKILAGQFYLKNQNNLRWLLGASNRLKSDKSTATLIGNANRLLIWRAIKYGKERDIKEFDLGGYYTGKKKDSEKERINNFKKTFGGELVYHYNYEKYYSRICKLAFKTYNIKQKFFIF